MAQNNYSIVVVGRMNPALHHPWWYEFHDLIDGEEFSAGLSSPDTLVSSSVTQLEFPTFAIKCDQDRWEINSTDRDNCVRLSEITTKIFKVLDQTPVSSFGFNVNLHIATTLEDVGAKLAAIVESAELPLPTEDGPRQGQLVYHIGTTARRRRVRVEQSVQDTPWVYIHQNIHYDIRGQGVESYFNLGDLVQPRFVADCDEAVELANKIASSLGE